ncbi:MAG: hypothetical protein V8Q78_06355 [Blautia sp.]
MMKNKAMRIAAGVGVTTLLTMSVISGSFAKYITSGTGTDSARAAKFGVTVTANGTMFASEYATDDEAVGTIAKSVISSGGEDDHVVAPGTKGELLNATITGKPEVAVKVSYEPTLTLNGWEYTDEDSNLSTEYFPIIFKVGDKKYGITGMKDSAGTKITNGSANVEALKTAVENAIRAYSKNYAANTDLALVAPDYVNVSWEWAYNGNSDEKDTYLGDQAAANKASTVELSMKTTVTQID